MKNYPRPTDDSASSPHYTSSDTKFVKAMRDYAKHVGLVELDKAKEPYLVEIEVGLEPWRTWRSVWMGTSQTVAVLR